MKNERELSKRKLLVADDETWIVGLLESFLKPYGFDLLKAFDGKEALTLAQKEHPDLILLDIKMPELNGLEVCRLLKNDKNFRFIPIIILTALEDEKLRAFDFGADDFLAKPFSHAELMARIHSHLRLKQYIEDLEDAESLLYTLARIIEVRDAHTEEHIERVAHSALKIAEELQLDEQAKEALNKGARLHDIGKVGIPDGILLKPDKLTKEEFEVIKRHVVIGEEICKPLASLKDALPIIRHHHERYDGGGYPDSLAGEEIPMLARIVAASDAFDAMTSNRPYRLKMSREDALEHLELGSGSQWDPTVIKVLVTSFKRGELQGSRLLSGSLL